MRRTPKYDDHKAIDQEGDAETLLTDDYSDKLRDNAEASNLNIDDCLDDTTQVNTFFYGL